MSTIQSFLTRVIDEGVKSALAQRALTEKEKQTALASSGQPEEDSSGDGVDDLFGGGGGGDDAGEVSEPQDDAVPSKTMDDESEKLKKGEIQPKDIVEKLNSIRGGKSFKDSKVAESMEEYIASLSKAERVALMAFLKGIAQIVTGEVPADAVADPSNKPSDVKMQKGPKKDVKHMQPNVIKGDKGPKQSGGGGIEDTSAPAPITPKRR